MSIDLAFEDVSGCDGVPGAGDFEKWLEIALQDQGDVSLAVRVVDTGEMQALNARYRGKDKPTNVLSFPADLPEAVIENLDARPLGDIVICAPVVGHEAGKQGKPPADHWAHLAIHGALHLLGHDHQGDAEAEAMESLEVKCLAALGIPDPYNPPPGL